VIVTATQWVLADALLLVRQIQPLLRERKWHVALGGGVLNTGESDKDLDLYFLPFGDHVTDGILPFLTEMWGGAEPFSANAQYHTDVNFATKVKFTVDGRRIDAFVAKHKETA
jgi:hypothetical protein